MCAIVGFVLFIAGILFGLFLASVSYLLSLSDELEAEHQEALDAREQEIPEVPS